MKIGIIGLPTSGKTTIFNALTAGHADTSIGGMRKDANHGVAKVPDDRVDFLVEMFKPKKITQATVEFTDVAGLTKGAGKESGFSNEFLGHLRDMEALLLTNRVFSNASVPHPEGSIDPSRDLETIITELILADMAIIEKRLKRIDESWNKQPDKRKEFELEKQSLHRFLAALENNQPIVSVTPNPDEILKYVRPYGLLSGKKFVAVANVSDLTDSNEQQWTEKLKQSCQEWNIPLVIINGALECDLREFPPEEWGDYFAESGLEGPAGGKVIQQSYEALQQHSFLTCGPDEVRAWTIPIGFNAQKAAGRIHSDIERGFIRAEVMAFDDLKAIGSIDQVKKAGKYRLEGKEYIVQDGDIIEFRFSV